MMNSTKILIIHDDINENDPLLVELGMKYGKENITLARDGAKGLEFIEMNLTSKLIVLIDFDLGVNQPNAPEVIERIRDKTSLAFVLIYTAKELSSIKSADWVKLINNQALALLSATDDTSIILDSFEKANNFLDVSVDCILEQWIENRPEYERTRPYMTTKSGKTYSLEELMIEIRKETEIGIQLKKGILRLAIELLTKGEKKLDV